MALLDEPKLDGDNTVEGTNVLSTGEAGGVKVLREDGDGTSSWQAVGGGGGIGDVSKVGTPVDDQVAVWTGDGTIEGTSGLTYDGAILTVVNEAHCLGWTAKATFPYIWWNKTDASADQGVWGMSGAEVGGTGLLQIYAVTDAGTGGTTYFEFARSGTNDIAAFRAMDTSVEWLEINNDNQELHLTTGDIVLDAGKVTSGGVIMTTGGNIVHEDATAQISYSGGTSSVLGAQLIVYGESHATTAGDFKLRSTTNNVIYWDESTGVFTLSTGTGAKTDALTVDNSQNATFAGDVDAQSLSVASVAITATPAELNLLDLAGLTAGWVLAADTATTASWQAAGGISNVVEDTTPQLGGDLDVQANKITTSTTDGTITIEQNLDGSLDYKTDFDGAGQPVEKNLTINFQQDDGKDLNINWVVDGTRQVTMVQDSSQGRLELSHYTADGTTKTASLILRQSGDIYLNSNISGSSNEPLVYDNSAKLLYLADRTIEIDSYNNGGHLTMAGGDSFPAASGQLRKSVTAGITAFATGGQGSATALRTDINQISTCATPGDSVKLPPAVAGSMCHIINSGAGACDVFPFSGDNLGAGVDTAASLAASASITYTCYDATNWRFLGTTLNDAFTTNTTTVITTSHTAAAEHVILVDDDTAASTVTVTLPAAADGLHYHIKKLGTTATVIIDGNASETIDGGLTATLTAQYEALHIVSDGSNWHVL